MIRIAAAAVLLTIATACGDSKQVAVDEAKAKLELIRQSNPTNGELCAAERAVSDAYLSLGDAESYKLADAHADIRCAISDLQGADRPYSEASQ